MASVVALDPVLPESSKRLVVALDPAGNSVALAASQLKQDAPLYFATYDFAEARELVLQTYQVCAAAQTISELPEVAQDEDAALEQFSRIGSLYAATLLKHLNRLHNELEGISDDESEQAQDRRERLENQQQHWTAVYQVFSLAQVLYFPTLSTSSDTPLPVVGEQLLHFINTVDPQPSKEDGLHLASLGEPYSEPFFWSYLPRCIIRGLFRNARTLTASMLDHPFSWVRHAASLTCTLLDRVPKASLFSTSHEHLRATHTFRMDVQRAISELTDQYDDVARWTSETPLSASTSSSRSRSRSEVASEDARHQWWSQMMLLLRLLKGEEETVLGSCDDWREALAAWAMFVRPTMTRDDIPDTVQAIWQKLPIEEDLPGEDAQEAFILGQTATALAKCDDLSPWLSTHLADLLDKIGALDDQAPANGFDQDLPASSSSLRLWYILRWADQLQGDEGVWRINLHYLAFVAAAENDLGEVAEERMKAILRHVKWRDPTTPAAVTSDKIDVQVPVSSAEDQQDQSQTSAQDVIKTCYEYGFEDVAVEVCKTAAEKLMTVREYGRAVAFVLQAGDMQRVARITELLIDEYIQHGASEFARIVDSFPTKLLRPDQATNRSFFQSTKPAALDGGSELGDEDIDFGAPSVAQMGRFQDQISFLARYRDVHAFFANEQKPEAAKTLVGLLRSGLVPQRFIGVLLVDALSLLEDEADVWFDQQDTFELMRCLELIVTKSTTDAAVLKPLQSLMGSKNWERVLLALRLSLTKNLSRCFCLA